MSTTYSIINPAPIQAWQLVDTNAIAIEEAFYTLTPLGWKSDVSAICPPNSNSLVWTVTLSKAGYSNLIAYVYDWIVYDGTNVTIYTNDQFVAKFTANVPLTWTPSITASAQSGAAATVSFASPTSPNGPFTYTLTQTDITTNATTVLTNPTVVNDVVTFNVSGLTVGDNYTFTAKVNTQYENVLAFSPASNSITAEA